MFLYDTVSLAGSTRKEQSMVVCLGTKIRMINGLTFH